MSQNPIKVSSVSCKRNRIAEDPVVGSSNNPTIVPVSSKIPKMCSVISNYNIGGIYDIQTADFAFLFDTNGVEVLVPAHKSILAADSCVFYRLFYQDDHRQGHFRIRNHPVDKFCIFLTSFYAKSMKLHRNDVEEVIRLAYQFQALKCQIVCLTFLRKSLETGVDDVLWILQLAIKYNCSEIRALCIEKIHSFAYFLIKTEQLKVSSREVLQTILKDDFDGRNEVKLLEACIKWAKRHVNGPESLSWQQIRYQIGDFFQLIRFKSMTSHEFIQCLSKFAHFFSVDEIKQISKVIVQSEGRMKPAKAPVKGVPRGRLVTLNHMFEHPMASFRKIFDNVNTSDVEFVFNETSTKILAHKSILASKSPVFKEHLLRVGAMKVVVIRMESTTPRFVTAFVKLLYGYSVGDVVNLANLEQIVALAQEFGVKDIFRGQERELKRFLSAETLFWAANLCNKYRFIDWVKFDINWIEQFCSKHDLNPAFHPNALLHCSRAIVKNAIEINYYNRNEVVVFEAAVNWAKNWCRLTKIDRNDGKNLRRALKGVLELIPFQKMTSIQFNNCINKYPGILEESEIRNIRMTQNSPIIM